MLNKQFDYTAAIFSCIEEINAAEVSQADIVSIVGKHELGIYHPIACRWKNFLAIDKPPEFSLRSAKEIKLIEKNKQLFIAEGYRFEITELDKNSFEVFKDIYNKTTMQKTRAMAHNLDERILGRILVGTPVYCSGMYKDGQLVSAAIFTINGTESSIHFSAKERFPKIQGGVGAILEWDILLFCMDKGVHSIDQGKSVNPAGLITTAGLFEFKARYGYTAYPEDQWVTTFFRNPQICISDMIFVGLVGDKIGYTVVSDKSIEEVTGKYSTREVKNISLITFDQIKARAADFFKL